MATPTRTLSAALTPRPGLPRGGHLRPGGTGPRLQGSSRRSLGMRTSRPGRTWQLRPVVVVDTSSPEQLGEMISQMPGGLIIIDHHCPSDKWAGRGTIFAMTPSAAAPRSSTSSSRMPAAPISREWRPGTAAPGCHGQRPFPLRQPRLAAHLRRPDDEERVGDGRGLCA